MPHTHEPELEVRDELSPLFFFFCFFSSPFQPCRYLLHLSLLGNRSQGRTKGASQFLMDSPRCQVAFVFLQPLFLHALSRPVGCKGRGVVGGAGEGGSQRSFVE